MVVYISAIFRPMTFSDQWVFRPMTHFFGPMPMVFGPMPYGMAMPMTLFRTNASSDQCNGFSDQWQCQWAVRPMVFRTNGSSDQCQWQWAVGPMVFRTNGSSDQCQWQWAVGPSTWHHYVYNACRSPKGMSNRRDAIGSRQDTSIIDHHTCTVHILHRVYTVFTSCTLYLSGSFGRW